jgi:cytochrome c-type biogenesis protein CcmH
MIALVVVSAVLTMATVWYLVRPILRGSQVTHEGYYQLAQLRDRLLAQLRELDIEIGDGNIDVSVAGDERLRLEAELAQVLRELETVSAERQPMEGISRRLIYTITALVIFIPLAAAGLYFGSHHTTLAQLGNPEIQTAGDVPPMVLEMVGRLEKRLKENPNDAAGWARLAWSYEVLGRTSDAGNAYQKAYQLAPNDVDIVSLYASHLLTNNPSAVPTPEMHTVFQKLHKLDPQHPGALWALGLAAYHTNNYRQAVDYWQKLMQQLPADSPVRGEVQRALEAARGRQ